MIELQSYIYDHMAGDFELPDRQQDLICLGDKPGFVILSNIAVIL